MTEHPRMHYARLRDIDLARSRWWLTVFALVAIVLALVSGIVDRPWAAFGFAYALIAFAYLAFLAWLDRFDRRPKRPGREAAAASPPSAVQPHRSSRPGS